MKDLYTKFKFHDVFELQEALQDLLDELPEKDEGIYPVVYVEDCYGNQFNTAKVYENTFTDGSKVFKVVLD
jgi:hypothetical protein